MELSDAKQIKGIFRLWVKDATGKVLEQYEDLNLVVNTGRTQASKLLGGDVTNRHVNRISFGTNGSAPALGDTAITGPFNKNVSLVSYPSAGVVKFDWSLELAENNGVTIREYGLLCADGVLFARKTRAAIDKTSAIRLEGSWQIEY